MPDPVPNSAENVLSSNDVPDNGHSECVAVHSDCILICLKEWAVP